MQCVELIHKYTNFESTKLDRERAFYKLKPTIKQIKQAEFSESLEPTIRILIENFDSKPEEGIAGLLIATQILENGLKFSTENQRLLLNRCLSCLDDSGTLEIRIRKSCAELVGFLCKNDVTCYKKLNLLDRIENILELDKRYLVQEVLVLRKKHDGRKRIRNDLGDAADNDSSGGEEQEEVTNKTAAEIHQDTVGWKSLENHFSCLLSILTKCTKTIVKEINISMLNLLYTGLKHKNRFIREIGYRICAAIINCFDCYEDFAPFSDDFVLRLATGLSDNWSQVRMTSSMATRNFLMFCDKNSRMHHYRVLAPRMCLNRYYVAEGVRIYSQTSWKNIMKEQGKEIIETYVSETVDFYIEQTEADNHAVREAACACIAEIAVKLKKSCVEPFVKRLLETLNICFRDESWPVRSASCLASGRFIKAFPEECLEKRNEFLNLFFSHLGEGIWSVREDAAFALGDLVDGYGKEGFDLVYEKLNVDICEIKNQPDETEKYSSFSNETKFGVATPKTLRDNDIELHTDQTMYSCGSLAPRLKKGAQSNLEISSQPWEKSDGCIYLIRELANRYPKDSLPILSTLAEVTSCRQFPQHFQFLHTLWKQLPKIAVAVGKKPFKQYIESFFDGLFYSIRCENRLASESAKECLNLLAQFLGKNILAGRIENYNSGYYRTAETILI